MGTSDGDSVEGMFLCPKSRNKKMMKEALLLGIFQCKGQHYHGTQNKTNILNPNNIKYNFNKSHKGFIYVLFTVVLSVMYKSLPSNYYKTCIAINH